MSKKTTEDVVETVDTSIETSTPIVDTQPKVCAYLVKREDGFYVEQGDEILGPCKGKFIKNEGDWVILPENASNRKMIKLVQANKFFDENGADAKLPLAHKATRTLGTSYYSTKLPNEKLIAYLPEAEQEEYKAIIARAIAARDAEREANKKKPATEADKAQAKVNTLIAKLKEMGVTDEEIRAVIENSTNKEVENNG